MKVLRYYLFAFWIVLLIGAFARADEFSDRTARFAAKTAAMKKGFVTHCDCGGDPSKCVCNLCACARLAKPPWRGDCHTKAELPKAPLNTFAHDCACPSSASCNCPASTGCHCAENRASNRAQLRWAHDEDGWHLYRGNQCIGAMNSKGSFYLWNGSEYMTEPCQPPIPLPSETSMQETQSYLAHQVIAVWQAPASNNCRS